MTPEPPSNEPRLVTVTRRSLTARSAGPGRSSRLLRSSAMAGALLVLPGLACGNDDADTFAAGDTATDGGTGGTATVTSSSVTTTLSGDQATTTISGDQGATGGAVFPDGAELAVSFTFEPDGTGRGPARNPYIAVWVEDASGNLVDTISVWYAQGGKGDRWLDDLRSWYSASGGSADTTVVGATRAAGSYTVVWDGTDLDGNPVEQGQYVLYVEAAREHGPYEITSADLAIGDGTFSVTLDDQGELSNVSAELIL